MWYSFCLFLCYPRLLSLIHNFNPIDASLPWLNFLISMLLKMWIKELYQLMKECELERHQMLANVDFFAIFNSTSIDYTQGFSSPIDHPTLLRGSEKAFRVKAKQLARAGRAGSTILWTRRSPTLQSRNRRGGGNNGLLFSDELCFSYKMTRAGHHSSACDSTTRLVSQYLYYRKTPLLEEAFAVTS